MEIIFIYGRLYVSDINYLSFSLWYMKNSFFADSFNAMT